MNCTGKRCIMQFDKVDPATCKCVSYCPQATPPKTNADRIRSMTDEELADWYFDKFFPCVPYCSILDECPEHDDCKICLLDWLKQESAK